MILDVGWREPGISKVDSFGLLIDHEALQFERLVVPLEAVVVLSEAAEIGLDYLLDLSL